MNKSNRANSHYYTHLKQKDVSRCVTLLIPVLGNIVVRFYDFANRKYNNKDFMLAAIQRQDWTVFREASKQLRDDKDFYEECSYQAKNNYKLFYSIDDWKQRMFSILNKD